METTYQPGDRVVIRDDLRADGVQYAMDNEDEMSLIVVTGMLKFRGTTVTIVGLHDSSSDLEGSYVIEEDNQTWGWTDGMILGLAMEAEYEIDSLTGLFGEE